MGAFYGGGTDHDEGTVMDLTLEELAGVRGGYSDADFGRCGPGSHMRFLGDVRTNECALHDAAVRGALKSGSSQLGAQLRALPLLPAAVGSYVRKRITGK
jgi:hypothetical protein